MELSHQPERGDSALDALEHQLYNPKNKMDGNSPHSVREKRELNLPTSWGNDAPLFIQKNEEKGFSFGAKFLILAMLLLVLSLSLFAYRVLLSRNVVSNDLIDVSLNISPYIEGGESSPLSFTLLNRNKVPLESAVITLEYKKGVGSQDEQEKVFEKREIGSINPNDYKQQDFNVVLYGGEAEQRDLSVKLEYKVAGSNGFFIKNSVISTILKAPQIAVSIDGPKVLSSNQSGSFVFTVKNNSATTSLPSILQMVLPNTFTVQDQEPKTSLRGNIWYIDPLKEGESKSVKISGIFTGTQGEKITLKGLVGARDTHSTNIGVIYSTETFDVTLRSSPLNFVIALDTDSGTTERLRYGDKSSITINYANTGDKILKNVEVILALSGDAALYKNIDPGEGAYDSIHKTITWNKANLPILETVQPKASGSFRVLVPIVLMGTNSPTLKLIVNGTADLEQKEDVISVLSKTWNVIGSATMSAHTSYKNVTAMVNTGPIPPVANEETSYTAEILVSAQNALTNAQVSFRIPSYVSWPNITSNQDTISFNEKTRTVTWLIGKLEADKSINAEIALVVKPSQSHVNQMPPITSDIVLNADEEISHAHIQQTFSKLTTYLFGENWPSNPSYVIDK